MPEEPSTSGKFSPEQSTKPIRRTPESDTHLTSLGDALTYLKGLQFDPQQYYYELKIPTAEFTPDTLQELVTLPYQTMLIKKDDTLTLVTGNKNGSNLELGIIAERFKPDMLLITSIDQVRDVPGSFFLRYIDFFPHHTQFAFVSPRNIMLFHPPLIDATTGQKYEGNSREPHYNYETKQLGERKPRDLSDEEKNDLGRKYMQDSQMIEKEARWDEIARVADILSTLNENTVSGTIVKPYLSAPPEEAHIYQPTEQLSPPPDVAPTQRELLAEHLQSNAQQLGKIIDQLFLRDSLLLRSAVPKSRGLLDLVAWRKKTKEMDEVPMKDIPLHTPVVTPLGLILERDDNNVLYMVFDSRMSEMAAVFGDRTNLITVRAIIKDNELTGMYIGQRLDRRAPHAIGLVKENGRWGFNKLVLSLGLSRQLESDNEMVVHLQNLFRDITEPRKVGLFPTLNFDQVEIIMADVKNDLLQLQTFVSHLHNL